MIQRDLMGFVNKGRLRIDEWMMSCKTCAKIIMAYNKRTEINQNT